MQDGQDIPAEQAGQWLREALRDEPRRHSELIIRGDRAMDPAARARLLEILFGPPTG